jgi:BNR/Asp-box repeat.
MLVSLMWRRVVVVLLGTAFSAVAQPIPPIGVASWTLVGPTRTVWPDGYPWRESTGRIRSIAVDSNGTVYIGAAVGGVWKRVGSTWVPLTDDQPSLASGAIAIDPSHPNTIYVGTGEASAQPMYYGHGILKSTDSGTTWTNIIGPFLDPIESQGGVSGGVVDGGARFPALAVSPTDSSVLLAAVQMHAASLAESGIYRSPDAGLSWAKVLAGDVGTSLVFDPTDGNIVYAALGSLLYSSAKGIYKSANAGRTWSLLTGTAPNALPTENLGQIRLAISRSSPRTLYAGISSFTDIGHLLGLYKTTDAGANWTRLSAAPDYCATFCDNVNEVAVHPRDPNIVLVGGVDPAVYRSLDGGTHWDPISSLPPGTLHVDVRAFAFSPDGSTVYAANDGGIAASTTIATTGAWNWMNDNLAITQFYGGFDVDPSNRDHVFAGTQDNGFQVCSGSLTWGIVTGGEGGNVLYDDAADTVYLAGARLPFMFGNYAAQSTRTGISAGEPASPLPPLAMNHSSPAIQYTATNRVYRTSNSQGLWTPISPALSASGYVTALAIANHNPDVVCAGTSDGRVWCTENASAASPAWVEHSAGLPSRYVTQVAVNGFKEYVIGVAFSGFSGVGGDTLGHVFYFTSGATTWTDISSNLPNSPANALVIDDTDDNQLYAGMDAGVFRTLDRGATWAPLARGLPHTVVSGLYLHQPTRTLFAGTMGRSMWRLSVAASVIADAPTATIGLRPWEVHFKVTRGGDNPQPQPLAVLDVLSSIKGAIPLKWTATASTAFGGSWLTVTPSSGTGDGKISVGVNTKGLAAGLYNGIVRIDDPSSTNGPLDVAVVLAVTEGTPARRRSVRH